MAIRFLSNETLDGTLTVNGLLTGASATFTSATINTGTGNVGLGVFTSGESTTPNVRFGRDDAQYVGFQIQDRINTIVFRQDETTGNHDAIFDIWSSTSGNKAFLFKASNNAGASSSTWLTIENSDATFARDVSVGRNLTVTGNITGSSGTGHFSVVNASAYQLNGTYVMDSSRNLVNIANITSAGNITATTAGNTLISSVSTANWAGMKIQSADASSAYLFFYDTSGERTRLQVTSNNDLRILTGGGGVAGFTQDSSGNVGLGTDSPNSILHVYGSNNGTSEYTTTLGSTASPMGNTNSGNTAPINKTLLTGYSIPYSGNTNARLTLCGFLEFASTSGWTGNQRTWAITSGYDIGGSDSGAGGNKMAIILGNAQNVSPQIGTNGAIGESGDGDGANSLVACYWDNALNMRLADSGRLYTGNGGSAGLPMITPGTDKNTGIWYPTSDTWAVSTAGTERFRIANNGYIGINENNPTSRLTIDNGSTAGGTLLKSSSSSYTAHFIGNSGTGNAGIYCDASNGDFVGSDYIFIGQHNDKWAQISTSSAAEGIRFMPRDNIQFTINNTGLTNIYNNTTIGSSSTTEPQRLTVLKTESNGNGIWRFGTSGTTFTHTGHRFFGAITSTATSNGWYTIGNVADSCSVIIVIKTAAHSQATILASRGYGLSNVARVQVLSSTKNANGGYANINAVRISGGGLIDMQLYWTSGPSVSVSVTYYGNGCDLPPDLRLSISDTGTYPYNVLETATFRNSAASARVAGELDIIGETHCSSDLNMYSTSKIYFHATSNSDQYIGAISTNDLEIGAGDDINYRSNFSRFFSGTTEHARLTGLSGSNNWLANGTNNKLGISNTAPQTTLHTGPSTTITNVFTARFAASNFFASGGNSMFYVPDTSANIMMFGSNQFGTNQIEFYHKNPGTSQAYVGRISTSGSATSYVTSSDYRLKENIVPISESISRLNQLKPSRFNFIEEPGKVVDGFIAHEVQDIVPEAIVGEKDEVDEEGGIIPQGIDQAKLVPLLVAAVQELEARVKELENK